MAGSKQNTPGHSGNKPSKAPIAPSPIPDNFSQTVIEEYPAPIAMPYSKMKKAEKEDDFCQAFNCFLNVIEGLIHYLTLIAISFYRRDKFPVANINEKLAITLLEKPLALGDYICILRIINKIIKSNKDYYFFQLDKEFLLFCGVLSHIRNRHCHGSDGSRDVVEPVYRKHQPELEKKLHGLSWLKDWLLVHAVDVQKDGEKLVVRKWGLLMGAANSGPLPERNIRLAEKMFDPLPTTGGVLLANPDGVAEFSLFPFCQLALQKSPQSPYLLQYIKLKNSSLKLCHYVAYGAGTEKDHEQFPNETPTTLVARLAEQLRASIEPIQEDEREGKIRRLCEEISKLPWAEDMECWKNLHEQLECAAVRFFWSRPRRSWPLATQAGSRCLIS